MQRITRWSVGSCYVANKTVQKESDSAWHSRSAWCRTALWQWHTIRQAPARRCQPLAYVRGCARLAALLYLGSGIGLLLYRLRRRAPAVHLPQGEWPWLAGAIFAGGILGPGLQMLGLTYMPASGAFLLLNAETVFTALLAWLVFKENFYRRIALGMGAILAGLLILSWLGEAKFCGLVPAFCVLGACFCWAVDNNLTRKVSLSDATWIASWKGLVAGFAR